MADSKSSPELGRLVHAHLVARGIETPMRDDRLRTSTAFRTVKVAEHFEEIMDLLGLDREDDSLKDTPSRWAKMMVDEMCSGLDYDNFPKCTAIENKMMAVGDEFVLEKKIRVSSMCEHHFVVIDGFADVAYIPRGKVLGLSKLNRIVDFFARRPQVQERLTAQIAETIAFVAETSDVAVHIDAVHHCVKSRGIRDANSHTETFHGIGVFGTAGTARQEFMRRSRV